MATISVETREFVCTNCTSWFQVTWWLYRRGRIVCPACGCDPQTKGVTAEQRARVHCEDKDREIVRLGRVIAGLRGALHAKRTRPARKGRAR